MSLCVLGMAEEFRAQGVAVNALWPRTAINTAAAITPIAGEETRRRRTRKAAIMADAAHAIACRPSRECTGRFFIDDEVLREAGVTDLSRYLPEGAADAVSTSWATSSWIYRARVPGPHGPQDSESGSVRPKRRGPANLPALSLFPSS